MRNRILTSKDLINLLIFIDPTGTKAPSTISSYYHLFPKKNIFCYYSYYVLSDRTLVFPNWKY